MSLDSNDLRSIEKLIKNNKPSSGSDGGGCIVFLVLLILVFGIPSCLRNYESGGLYARLDRIAAALGVYE